MSVFLQTLRRNAVALFVTFHIICVLICALPRPPSTDANKLEDPEVKGEMQRLGFSDEQRRVLLQLVVNYTRSMNKGEHWLKWYLVPTGTQQTWNMFGGTPPRYPLVFVVEVQPEGESGYLLFQD